MAVECRLQAVQGCEHFLLWLVVDVPAGLWICLCVCFGLFEKSYLKQLLKDDSMETFSEIINDNRLVLVDFFATWCGPCKMMHPVLEQLKGELGEDVRIIKLDVDRNEKLAAAYRIQSVPTLVLFRGGEVLWRQSGAVSLVDLKSRISAFL